MRANLSNYMHILLKLEKQYRVSSSSRQTELAHWFHFAASIPRKDRKDF